MTRLLLALGVVVAVGACSDQSAPPGSGALAERGRQVYLGQCTTCHNPDPAHPGPLGPPLRGSSRELLEAKLLRGGYPDGYRPKRPTAIMPAQPAVAGDIPALAAFLR